VHSRLVTLAREWQRDEEEALKVVHSLLQARSSRPEGPAAPETDPHAALVGAPPSGHCVGPSEAGSPGLGQQGQARYSSPSNSDGEKATLEIARNC